MNKDEFADGLLSSITHAIMAHSKHPKTAGDAIRYWDNLTPYAIHPIWCATTLLTETGLPEKIRYDGYQAPMSSWITSWDMACFRTVSEFSKAKSWGMK